MRPTSTSELMQIPAEESQQALSGEPNSSEFQDESGVFVFPASLEQIRYWTLDQLDGTSTASNMAIAARLEGEVNDHIVEQSIQAIVERHEALRTTFRVVDGLLSQIISEEARYSFAVTDLRSLPEADRAQAAEAAVEEHSHARADLATGPAFFVRLIHLTDRLHFLAFTMHHIVCDGWSNGILIRDFTDFYAAFSQHREPALPALPFQFADFTVWQQNWLESDAARSALDYWRTHIRRGMPAVDLPTDRPRLPQKSYPGHIESSLLQPALTERLKAYCRSHGATMHQVLLAAFEALIARYANQSEFLLGSTIANRTQPGMENVVGRFANPQVILADVNGDPSYRTLVDRVVAWSTESYAHQDLPFSRLMEEFQLDQAGATSQFLQVYFVYQKAFMQPQEAQGLRVVPRPSVSGGVNFDLLVSIVERAEGPRLQMEYNTVLFRKERIVSLIEMYIRVLEAVMANDSVTVSQLPLVEQAEQQTLSASSNSSVPSQFPAVSLAEWIDRQIEALGDAQAVLAGTEKLSWKELHARSLSIASSLRERAIAPGQTVAVRLESGINTAAICLALLRIGAIVLPIPSAASAREWAQILASQQPALALASSVFSSTTPGLTAYEELLTSAETPLPALFPQASSTAWLGIEASSDDSSNTFTAIPSSHAATLQHLLAAAREIGLRQNDVVLITPAQSATDAWVDLMLPLVAGATVLYPEEYVPEQFQQLLNKYQVAFAFASPSDLLTALHHLWAGDRRLSIVVRGGLVSNGLVKRLSGTPLRLSSLISTPLNAGPLAVARVSVGSDGVGDFTFHALVGQQLLVVDENGERAPSGVYGELAIAGDSTLHSTPIRTGYLARFSAEIPPRPGRTAGIEIIDKASRVVRLHGYRLRLGELEDLVWQHPSVSDVLAALLPVNDAPTLVAYFRPFESGPDASRIVREHFRSIAPGHVAAAEIIAVDSFPRRVDGSIDFSLLPAPGSSQSAEEVTEEYVAARDELESNLVSIWEEVLGVQPIGIRSPFFKLGGYSLMIVRLFARINKVMGTSLPITTIFNAPTVEQLADIIRGRAYYSSLVPVQTKGSRSPFFMIHSYLLYQGIPRVLGEDYPFYGLRELDTDAENMSVEQRAASYLDAIRSVQPHGPYYIGGWCAAGPLAVETARQITASGEDVGILVLFDSWRPGYAAELARDQAGSPEMSLRARLRRKYLFHKTRWNTLSYAGRIRYLTGVIGSKSASVRDRFYLKNWAVAEWLCKRFGLSLPHFMHNVSLTTLNSLKEYKGIEPYPGLLTLIRAKEAPYFPGAQEACGWDAIVTGGVKVLWAPGDHESMFLPPHLQKVGTLLHESLTEAYAQQS
ncbi:condensation domain-containing protein [Acidicapsa ligni]|uniref:condensation domain-containing protein n=1 Tax=Acidicapsa ligni TaxID=542300 RepID=UPI0021DF886F|nr:condensation domain-containing protein [Acidicapsa ligni]